MAIHSSAVASGFTRGQQRNIKTASIPAPLKGIDTRVSLGKMSTDNCIFAYNMIPEESGMRVRNGFREHQIAIESVSGLGVGTIMTFTGLTGTKLFVVTNEGIWDVTTEDGTPTLKYTFVTDTTAASGHGVSLNYITGSGAEIMFYADSKNGLFKYDEGTDAWTVVADMTGVTETAVCFIMEHKQRIWLIERDATSAWYLGIGASSGAATEFSFGDKFPHGGYLAALINWSIDGGKGVDDFLVAVGSSGDVIPYSGADPGTVETSSTVGGWSVRGSYYIGGVPAGRRFFDEYSGELYLLSTFGLIAMSDLLRGVDTKNVANDSLTYPIASVLREQLAINSSTIGWEPTFLPSQGRLVVNSPTLADGTDLQYAMSLAVEGWGFWRGVPGTVFIESNGITYMGTADNRIFAMNVTRDYMLLDTGDADYLGSPVEYSLLTAYSDAGSGAINKNPLYVRPYFLVKTQAAFRARVFFDYDIAELIFPNGSIIPDAVATWDSAVWDTGVWSGGQWATQSFLESVAGMGKYIAIALRGETGDGNRLIAFDIAWLEGDFT